MYLSSSSYPPGGLTHGEFMNLAGCEIVLQPELGIHDQANVILFDQYEEVLWVGTQRGRLMSYVLTPAGIDSHTGSSILSNQPYSRFQVDEREERVVHLCTTPDGVITVTRSNILAHSRGGVSQYIFSKRAIKRMTSGGLSTASLGGHGLSAMEMFPAPQGNLMAVGSDCAKTLYYADMIKGELSTFFDLPHTVAKIHAIGGLGQLCAFAVGGMDGRISFVEKRTPKVFHTVSAHPFEVTSIASNANHVFTCGRRDSSRTSSDLFLKVFDIRNLRHSIPIAVQGSAVRVVTSNNSTSTIHILSQNGYWQSGDLFPGSSQLRSSQFYKTECFAPHSPDLPTGVVDWTWASSGTTAAMLDTAGIVHLWSKPSADHQPINGENSLNNLLIPSNRVNAMPPAPGFSNLLTPSNRDTMFEQIPTRVYSDTVRSGSWLSWFNEETGNYFSEISPLRPPVVVLEEIATSGGAKFVPIASVKNGELLCKRGRNALVAIARKRASKFGSGTVKQINVPTTGDSSEGGKVNSRSPPSRHNAPYLVPDLDAETLLLDEAPEENHLSGAPPKRWKYTQVDYSINHSLFPFHSFNRTSAPICGLENNHLDFLNAIVQVLYWVCPGIRDLVKSHHCERELCVSCELGFLFHMMDELKFCRSKVVQPVRLSRVVKRVLEESSIIFGEQDQFCDIWSALMSRINTELNSRLGDLYMKVSPDIFSEETYTSSDRPVIALALGRKSVPKKIFVHNDTGKILLNLEEDISQYTCFVLGGCIVRVDNSVASGPTPGSSNKYIMQCSTPTRKSFPATHFVAVLSVPEELSAGATVIRSVSAGSDEESTIDLSGRHGAANSEWILFNDFVVTLSSASEACEFGSNWKSPVMAFYVDFSNDLFAGGSTESQYSSLEEFTVDKNISQIGATAPFVPMSREELGRLLNGAVPFTVALDTEFISIGFGAVEIREDGSREIGKPGDMVVGRVSVIRVMDDPKDELDGVPILDHYVAMDESEIKDYLTRFSGIKPGDLDPRTSPHWLTSSKQIYKKIRFLVDNGCRFVGHGLHTDFRILNVHVPSSNVIDTVELFHIPGQRFLSLKFLAAKLLNKVIQNTNVHCSVEDAKTAMELYRKYLKLVENNELEATVKQLYEIGRTQAWK